MKYLITFTILILIALWTSGCRTNQSPQGQNALDAIGKLENIPKDVFTDTFQAISSVNSKIPTNFLALLNGPDFTNKPDRFLTTKSFIIANGSTNYTVNIHYTGVDIFSSTDKSNAINSILNLSAKLFKMNPDVHEFLSTSNLQAFANIFTLISQLKNVPTDLAQQTNLNAEIHDLLNDQLAQIAENQSTNYEIHLSLEALAAAYFQAYLNGSFVDRWGTSISQPDITKLGNDDTVAFSKVLLEALFDYSDMTPIVYDPGQSGTNKTPTFAVIFPQLYEKTSTNPDARGVTSQEFEALSYLCGVSDEAAKHLSSLIIRSIGGADIGVKVSTGDNDTLAQMISTICEQSARRETEASFYGVFEQFEYYPTNNSLGFAPDFNNNHLITNRAIKLLMSNENVQTAILTLLITQDDLKNLLKGGWKLSANNIANYEALADKLTETNVDDPLHVDDGPLFDAAQAIARSKGHLSANQQQALINALNQLVQTNGYIYNPAAFTNIVLSSETQVLLKQNPQGADLVHLNWSLLMDAFSNELARPPNN
jgi:hypothetical protein